MHFNSNSGAGHAIAEIAQDTYQMFRGEDSLLGDDTAVFEYRVSISDHEADVDVNTYFFVAMDKSGSVWVSMSDDFGFTLPNEYFIFREERSDEKGWTRARSYRHYIFSDVLSPMVERRLDEIAESLKKPERPYLWNTMSLVRRINRTDARIAYYGEEEAKEITRMSEEGNLLGVMLATMK